MRVSEMRLAGAVVAAAVFAPFPAARAESVAAETVALGWQTEHADAVVVGSAGQELRRGEEGPVEMELQVTESIRGPSLAGTAAVVVVETHGRGRPYVPGGLHLAFLRALPREGNAPQKWAPLSGSFGIRPIPESGPEARFPGIARAIAATLGEDRKVADEATLRAKLVGWVEDEDPGIAWSAATDLVRHRELVADLTDEERQRIVAAFRRQPVGKETKRALALAAAATKSRDAGRALVEALGDPAGRRIRGAVGEALRRLADPEATASLLKELQRASGPHRADVLQVLGTVGAGEAAPAVRGALADRSPEVRVEAAHALGRIARDVREKDPEARVGGREELARLLADAVSEAEVQATVWALAQLDDPGAFSLLRRAAAEDGRESVRRFAERYLRNPRQSLVLR